MYTQEEQRANGLITFQLAELIAALQAPPSEYNPEHIQHLAGLLREVLTNGEHLPRTQRFNEALTNVKQLSFETLAIPQLVEDLSTLSIAIRAELHTSWDTASFNKAVQDLSNKYGLKYIVGQNNQLLPRLLELLVIKDGSASRTFAARAHFTLDRYFEEVVAVVVVFNDRPKDDTLINEISAKYKAKFGVEPFNVINDNTSRVGRLSISFKTLAEDLLASATQEDIDILLEQEFVQMESAPEVKPQAKSWFRCCFGG